MAAALEQRPYEAYHEPGKTASAVLAVAMHLLLAALLVLGINWQSRPPEAVTVELWTAPPPPPAPEPPRVEPKPVPKVEAPPPPPKVEPRPEPKVEQKPDIAIEQEKRRLEQERKEREAEAERQKKHAEQKKAEELKKQEEQKKLAEQKRLEEEKRAAEQKKLAEQKKAEDAKRAADDQRRLAQQNRDRMNAELARELGNAPSTPGIPGARITGPANVAGATSGDTDAYRAKIAAKIKGNVILPNANEIAGNPTAEFDVQQANGGHITRVTLRKSSGNPALDLAWERAILKSTPLPPPDNPAAFQSQLTLRFRPND